MVLVSTAELFYNTERELNGLSPRSKEPQPSLILVAVPLFRSQSPFFSMAKNSEPSFRQEGNKSALVGGLNEKTAIGFSRSWVVEETLMSSCLHQTQAGLWRFRAQAEAGWHHPERRQKRARGEGGNVAWQALQLTLAGGGWKAGFQPHPPSMRSSKAAGKRDPATSVFTAGNWHQHGKLANKLRQEVRGGRCFHGNAHLEIPGRSWKRSEARLIEMDIAFIFFCLYPDFYTSATLP